MKNWLRNIERKFDYTDKSNYSYVLNQGERNHHIPEILWKNFLDSLTQEDIFFYPNTKQFKEKICEFYGVESDQLFLCAGSDVGIKSVIEACVLPTPRGEVVSSIPSFPMYKVYTDLYQGIFKGVSHEKDYTISTDHIINKIYPTTDLIILANPNSPMGEYKSFEEIERILDFDVPVLIDEAYIEFSGQESLVSKIKDYPNLIVTKTFSKAFGAAGCRVGMVFSSPYNIEMISKFRHMYEISGVSMKYCEFLLDNYSVVSNYVEAVRAEKELVIGWLSNFGYDVIDSNCNWIHFNNESDNANTMKIFEKYNVLVKYCKIPHDDRKNWCRLTINPNIFHTYFIHELR